MKIKTTYIFFLGLLLCGVSLPLFSQLTTNNNITPVNLVQNVLLGSGVNVSNVVYTGDPQAIGEFNYTGSNLAIAKGIILTTGTIVNGGDGPQGPNNSGSAGLDNFESGYLLLDSLVSPNLTKNAAILEFDFIPQGNLVSFKYIFGSEEYLEYANSSFNDVFALFISGPGFAQPTNIAKLPNLSVVSINTVNNINNPSFYVDNGDGSTSPYNASNQCVQYDGLTKLLTASATVQCGQKYHLIIAIADVFDGAYDSGIFLEAQSLNSEEDLTISHNLNVDYYKDNQVLAEGCDSLNVTLHRKTAGSALTVNLQTTGSATSGVDYSTLPTSITFNAADTVVKIPIKAFSDLLNEGDETIVLNFSFMSQSCSGNLIKVVDSVIIRNVNPIQGVLTTTNDTIFCGDNTSLTISVTGGISPYTYQWNNGLKTATIQVHPTLDTTYQVTFVDACLKKAQVAQQKIVVLKHPIQLNTIPDFTVYCPYQDTVIQASLQGSSSVVQYSWYRNDTLISTSNPLHINLNKSNTYKVIARNSCNAMDTVTFNANLVYTFMNSSITSDQYICGGDSSLIQLTTTGGTKPYVYLWSTGDTTQTIVAQPTQTTVYWAKIWDDCHSYYNLQQMTVTVQKPTAKFSVYAEDYEINKEVVFSANYPPTYSINWNYWDSIYSTQLVNEFEFTEQGDYPVTLYVVDNTGCKDSIMQIIHIGYCAYLPNSFTPDGKLGNNIYQPILDGVNVINFVIVDRWGNEVYQVNQSNLICWDGTFKGKDCPIGTYVYKIVYQNEKLMIFEKSGTINLIR